MFGEVQDQRKALALAGRNAARHTRHLHHEAKKNFYTATEKKNVWEPDFYPEVYQVTGNHGFRCVCTRYYSFDFS